MATKMIPANVATVVALSLEVVKADRLGGSLRDAVIVAALSDLRADKVCDSLDAFFSRWTATVRAAIVATYSAETVAEYKSYTDRERAERISFHTDANPAFRNADVAELHARLAVIKTRAADAKIVGAAWLAGDLRVDAFLNGDMSASRLLADLRAEKSAGKPAKEAKDEQGGQDAETVDASTLSAEQSLEIGLSGAIAGAMKNGMTLEQVAAVVARVMGKVASGATA